MRKLYLFLVLITNIGFAQTVIFSENMGNPTGETDIVDHTFENGSPILFSGNADIRITTPSTGYEGASGNGSVFIGSTLITQSFKVEGINTSNYNNLVLSFGHYKSTNAGSNELTVEVSADGNSWTVLTYTRPTGSGSTSWLLITPSGTIPSTSNLRIRFTNPTNNTTPLAVGFRIDDIKLTGTVLGVDENTKSVLKIYPNPLTGRTLYIDSASHSTKAISIYDVLGKQVFATNTAANNINLSELKSGIYIIKVNEDGKSTTRKLVVK